MRNAARMAAMLNIDVTKRLGDFSLNASFTSDSGVTALFGRSGSGKTTLVNAIAGLLRPERGVIEVDGECLYDSLRGIDVPVASRRVGYVFQEGRLFPHLTVRGNLSYGYRLTRADQRYVEFAHVVELLGLGGLLDRRPGNLSGGEKQRAAIGRALLASPRVLLMDEPLAALDQQLKAEILEYIERLHANIRIPIIYVTHAIEEIVRLADVVVIMAAGSVVTAGKVSDIMGRPELREQTGRFEGGTVIKAKVVSRITNMVSRRLHSMAASLSLRPPMPASAMRYGCVYQARDVSIALTRPPDISVLNVLSGRLVDIHAEGGPSANVRIDVGGVRLLARITRFSLQKLALSPGQQVYALVKAVSLDR